MNLDKWLKATSALGITLLVVVFVVMPIGSWIFATSSISQRWALISTGAERIVVRIEASREYSRFPPRDETITMLMIKSSKDPEQNNLTSNDRKRLERSMHWDIYGYRVLYFENKENVPTVREISVFLGEALEQSATSMKTYATEISNLLLDASNLKNVLYANTSKLAPSFQNTTGGGNSMSNEMWPPALLIFLIASFLSVILLPTLVFSYHNPGIRPVIDGEWLALASPK